MSATVSGTVARVDEEPPRSRRPPARPIAVLVAVAANLIVATNAARHPPTVGYDAAGHLSYARALASGRLPSRSDTKEFFSAPLPYSPVAAAIALGLPLERAAKVGQAANVAVSLVLTVALLSLCGIVRPGDDAFAALAVSLTCLLPVYAKSFSQVRGEPWVAAATVLLVLLLARRASAERPPRGDAVVIGLTAAGAVLSRQWGVLAVGGAGLWAILAGWRSAFPRKTAPRLALVSLPLLLVAGGWFYLSLAVRTGSPAAFNQARRPLPLAGRGQSFVFGTGSGWLFAAPIRPAFPNQLLPIFHSEIWGDYWCYFLVSGRLTESGDPVSGKDLEAAFRSGAQNVLTNRDRIAPYLGRLNLLGVPVSLLLLAGAGLGLGSLGRLAVRGRTDTKTTTCALAGAVIAVSAIGYLAFLLAFPSPGKGDTIKATYMLHAFPMLGFLAAESMARLRGRFPRAYRWCLAALAVITVHALPALFTRY